MSEVDPDLDDEIERAAGFGFLSDIEFGASMMAGAMMASGPPRPARARKDAGADPAGVLQDDEEQVRRRIAQITPGGANHYVAMLQALREAERRPTAVSEAFHDAREALGAIGDTLLPIARLVAEQRGEKLRYDQLKPEDNGRNRARRQDFVDFLGLDGEIERKWAKLPLPRYAHRNDTGPPRNLTPEVRNAALEVGTVALTLVELHERRLPLVLQEIAARRAEPPTDHTATRLANLVRHNPRTVEFFFDELADPRWWPLLSGRSVFDQPPEPRRVVHPIWPASRYLARIAGEVHDRKDRQERLVKIGENTSNVRVHEDIVRAALALPADDAFGVLQHARTWLCKPLHGYVTHLVGDPGLIRFPTWYAQLALRMATSDELDETERADAREMLRELLDVVVVPESTTAVQTRWLDGNAFDVVVDHLLLRCEPDAHRVLLEFLAEVAGSVSAQLRQEMPQQVAEVEEQLPEEDSPDRAELALWLLRDRAGADLSHLLARGWLGCDTGADQKSDLVSVLGSVYCTAEAVLSSDAAGWEEVLRLLTEETGNVGLLSRARLALLGRHPGAPSGAIRAAVFDPVLRTSATVRAEYTDLLVQRWSSLLPVDREGLRDTALAESGGNAARLLQALAPLSAVDDDPHVRDAVHRCLTNAPELSDLLSTYRGFPDGDDEQRHPSNSPAMIDLATAPPRWEPPARSEPPAYLTELKESDRRLTADDWNQGLADLAAFGFRTPSRQKPEGQARTAVMWLEIIIREINSGHQPSDEHLRKLARLLTSAVYSADRLTLPEDRTPTGRHALDTGWRQPPIPSLLLAIDILTNPMLLERLRGRDRRKLLTYVTSGFAAASPARPLVICLLGLLATKLYVDDRDLFNRLVTPLLSGLPDLGSPETCDGVPGRPWAPGRSFDVVCLFSGLLAERRIPPAGFIRDHEALYQWVLSQPAKLPLEACDMVVHVALALVADLSGEELPGPDVQILFHHCPTMGLLDALRKLAPAVASNTQTDASFRAGRSGQLRATWEWVRDWVTGDDERAAVLAAIGTWAADPSVVNLLGETWILDQLEDALRVKPQVDKPEKVVSSLTDMLSSVPEAGPRVTAYATRLCDAGLLTGEMRDTAEALLQTLSHTDARAPEGVAQLRGSLTARGIVGPLASW